MIKLPIKDNNANNNNFDIVFINTHPIDKSVVSSQRNNKNKAISEDYHYHY